MFSSAAGKTHLQGRMTNSREQRSRLTDEESTCLLFSSSLSYPQAVMDKIKEMAEGIVVPDAPVYKVTKDGVVVKGKRSATAGNAMHIFNIADCCIAVWPKSFSFTRNSSGGHETAI